MDCIVFSIIIAGMCQENENNYSPKLSMGIQCFLFAKLLYSVGEMGS